MKDLYWDEQDYKDLENAKEYKDLLPIALRVIDKIESPISQVCGPISTGGHGSIKENGKEIIQAIESLRASGKNIFNQMPLEHQIRKIMENDSNEYPYKLLEDVYLPLFKSGKIETLYFVFDWQTSTGAKWEHEQAQKLGLKIEYLN
jgi:hypothetical protein